VNARGVLLLCAATLLGGCGTGLDKPPQQRSAVDSCAALAAPEHAVFTTRPTWVDSDPLPTYCRVRGVIDSHVQFEMRLPERWNRRFMMAGCGGFCGELLPDKPGHSNAINEALKRGYAAISHDGGHEAPSWETGWAADREALELWAHKVLPAVAGAGVQLATDMYGEPPRYRYFSGCSNGGRLGLMAAQRYPGLFDGIAAGGSIFDLSGIAGLWGNWLLANNPAATPVLPRSQVPLMQHLVMEQCDGIDGNVDGVIDDPRRCRVDFRTAMCEETASTGSDCLTQPQADMLNRLYGGVRNDAGDIVYPAALPGSEYYADVWLFGSAGLPAWGQMASDGYRRLLAESLAKPDPGGELSTDEMLDWIARSPIPAMTDATDPGLLELHGSGSKLLVYQGWSDPLIIPEPITRYFQQAADAAGGWKQLGLNARLFMVPGWGHCWEKPATAPDDFDPLLELERWVEQGRAPDFIVARQMTSSGAEMRSRPVCSYPSRAKLVDSKNPDRSESYRCTSEDGSARP